MNSTQNMKSKSTTQPTSDECEFVKFLTEHLVFGKWISFKELSNLSGRIIQREENKYDFNSLYLYILFEELANLPFL